ncbi:MAG: ABC alpha-glucoside transporter, inner membrane subunit AglF [Ktedonobacterales bacterium]|nr:MAG: ABC alpha-glucoside transporter, inner membrane subunit AglF [Ktedonobacterales bacterium]
MATTLYTRANRPKSSGERWARRGGALVPWLWIAPAILFVAIFLLYPVINTIWLSLLNFDSSAFAGLTNYRRIFTDPRMLLVLRNNLLWLVVGTVATVFLGLVIAVLVDRVRIESIAKSAIFIPMAISFVGAGVIWRFVYQYAPPGQAQTGLLNAFVTNFGVQPQAWLINPTINNFALITVYVWMWTGFCMVILSAALKGVPAEILEAARVDGASEVRIFFRIIVPMIAPTIAVVATTMIINLLKIFDIVYVMTGGNFRTNVVAVEYYQQQFNFGNFGLSSALAVLLLIAIIPIMLYNIRRFRQQEAQR